MSLLLRSHAPSYMSTLSSERHVIDRDHLTLKMVQRAGAVMIYVPGLASFAVSYAISGRIELKDDMQTMY